MTDLAKLVVTLEAQTAKYQADLEKAKKQLSGFDRDASQLAASISKGLAVAAASAATAFAFMTKEAIDNQDRILKLSQAYGLSTEALSQMEYAASLSGVRSEEFAQSLGRLSKSAGDAAKGLGTSADAFSALGINVTNADGSLRSTDSLLLDLADKFSQMKDGTAKTALAMDILGKSGARLIPFLNQGRTGIAALTREADQMGLTVGGKSARAAEQFNDNLERLKSATKGVVNQAVQQFLPALTALTDRFVQSAKEGGGLNAAITLLAGTFKTLLSAGVAVKSLFQQLGEIIYGVGAAIVRVVQGDFSLARDEITSAFARARANATDDMELIAGFWSETVANVSDSVGALDDSIENSVIFSDTKLAEKAKKAAESAADSLQKMVSDLQQQVDTFGLAESAVIRYRVSQGDLADTIALAGEGAAIYGERIIELSDRMTEFKTSAEMAKQTQDEWNAAVDMGKAVTESVRTPLENYQIEIEKLNDMLALGVITQETYARAVAKAKDSLDKSMTDTNNFIEDASKGTARIISSNLQSGFDDGAKGIARSFADLMKNLAAQAIAAAIVKKIFGGEGGGGGGGGGGGADWVGLVTSIFGAFAGTRDSGGRGSPGKAYMIGTGAQPEMFVPDQPGKFIPADDWMGKGRSTVNLRMVNAFSPDVMRDYMLSSSGEEVILNVIDRNSSRIRSVVG